jgi:hypothetical protein
MVAFPRGATPDYPALMTWWAAAIGITSVIIGLSSECLCRCISPTPTTPVHTPAATTATLVETAPVPTTVAAFINVGTVNADVDVSANKQESILDTSANSTAATSTPEHKQLASPIDGDTNLGV